MIRKLVKDSTALFFKNSLQKSVNYQFPVYKLAGFQPQNYFCTQNQANQQNDEKKINIDFKNEQQEQELQFKEKSSIMLEGIDEYEKALLFFQKGKYRISNEFFKRVLKKLEQGHQENTLNYILVLKKLVMNQNMLGLYSESEATLEKIIRITQRATTSDALLYREYNNLFLHLINTNLNKSIILGKALLSESEIKNIPVLYQKHFTFNLGTAYLLKGNFADAKKRLRDCLVMKPNSQLKGYALNNLAVASWWHKHPNFHEEEEDEEIFKIEDMKTENSEEYDGPLKYNLLSNYSDNEEYSFEQIDKDFENVIPLLKRAIYNLESVEKISDLGRKMKLEKLLDSEVLIPTDIKEFDPSENILLSTKSSGIPLLNIQEFLFNTSPERKNEATYWFKYALKFFEQVDPGNIDRCLITLAIFCSSSNQIEKAEGLFKKTLEMLEGSDSFNKVLCLQLYGNLLKKIPERYKEGESLVAQAYAISDLLPFWSNKIVHVCIPELEY